MQPDKTRICFVITKGNWGGAQKYVYNLATLLPREKYDVLVICGAGNILREKLVGAGVRVIELESLKRDISITKELKSFLHLFKIIFQEKPNILHLNSPKAGGLGSVIALIIRIWNFIIRSSYKGPKAIYTAHGWTFNEKRRMAQSVAIYIVSWVTVVLCNRTIVIAEREKSQAQTMPFVRDEKVVLIKNGVEKTKFLTKTNARKELITRIGKEIPDKVFWIGGLAELHKNKGLSYALSAISKLAHPVVFFIIGEGEERKKLETYITELNLQDKVFLVGFLENGAQYLSAFNLFLLSSVKEGLPYSILEAAQAELPIVSTGVGGIPEIIDNGVNGILVTKEKPGEMTRAIQYLIDNNDKRKVFGKSIKEKIEREFSVEKMLEETEKLYQTL